MLSAPFLERLRQQDNELLTELILMHRSRLMSYLRGLTRQQDLAEEIFQETWLLVLRRGNQLSEEAKFESWLFQIARNLSFDSFRKIQRLRSRHNQEREASLLAEDMPSDWPNPMEQCLAFYRRKELQLLLGTVPEPYRDILYLRFYQDLTLEEIAAWTCSNVSTVKTRFYRGLHLLREELLPQKEFYLC